MTKYINIIVLPVSLAIGWIIGHRFINPHLPSVPKGWEFEVAILSLALLAGIALTWIIWYVRTIKRDLKDG